VFEDLPDVKRFELTAPKGYKEPDLQRKVIQIGMLFGPNKPAGPASFVKKRQRFGHKRVFGHKTAAKVMITD
jgi:hypothetical protein